MKVLPPLRPSSKAITARARGDRSSQSGVQEAPRIASDRQQQIFIAASKLFVERGFAGTSMSDIADAVQITKAGLYHFVSSKEDLLFTIMSYGMDRLELDVVQPARAVSDPLERLRVIVRNHAMNVGRVVTESGSPLSIVVDEPAGLSPENRKIIDARKREYFDLLRGTLQALKDEGRVREGLDTTVAAFTIIGMVMWIARWRRPEGRLSLEHVADQISSTALAGVGIR